MGSAGEIGNDSHQRTQTVAADVTERSCTMSRLSGGFFASVALSNTFSSSSAAAHRKEVTRSATPTITFTPPRPGSHTATVVLCHGLGDTGDTLGDVCVRGVKCEACCVVTTVGSVWVGTRG
jgi:hypothetical protein